MENKTSTNTAASSNTTKAIKKRKKRRERFDWWKLPWLLLLPLGFAWPRICAGHAEWIEQHYSAAVYPVIKDALSVLTSLVPISVAELVLYALLLGTAIELLGNLIAWILRRVSGKRMLSVLLNVAILGGVLLNLFYFTWGFNYFRTPLSERMGMRAGEYSTEELAELTQRLADEANVARVSVAEDENGVAVFTTDLQTVLEAMPKNYETLSKAYPVFDTRTTRAKRVLYSEGLSWAGIAGVYIGITAEPNINVKQPPLLIPQGAAHETAHQIGIASEDAAEFAAYLCCLQSEDPFVRYSGIVGAMMHCRSALRKADPARAESVRQTFSEAVMRDLVDYDAFWDRYNGPVEETVSDTNDSYLKHNAQESGVQSYGEVVDLLLAYYNQTNR